MMEKELVPFLSSHPLMVKAIAYPKVKTDKVDARILADLLRTDMIPECYIPDEKIRDLRDLARNRYYFVNTRPACGLTQLAETCF